MSAPLTRRLLLSGAAATLALPAAALAHTPYRQWVVYRKAHLLVGCHRDDDAGYALAKAVAAQLVAHLPRSKARVARAPSAPRLAALLATDQLDIAVLDDATAVAMADGRDRFASVGSVKLSALVPLKAPHLLISHARLRVDHAALIIDALRWTPLVARDTATAPPLPLHPALGAN